jgi:hypothetical protein
MAAGARTPPKGEALRSEDRSFDVRDKEGTGFFGVGMLVEVCLMGLFAQRDC